jgi:hypothetical protein
MRLNLLGLVDDRLRRRATGRAAGVDPLTDALIAD